MDDKRIIQQIALGSLIGIVAGLISVFTFLYLTGP